MNDLFKSLLETKDLWLPALTWQLGQLSASGTGIKIEEGIKKHLKWIKDPESEKAFQEAFNVGIQKYKKNRANNESAQAVARILVHVVNHDTSNLDRTIILEQIFADQVDTEAISSVVSRHIFAMEGEFVSKDVVSKELQKLINTYLRPAFRSQRYFTELVGFAEMIGVLKDIKENLNPSVDLDVLQEDYYKKISSKYEYLTMQGISPKVQNRTIGIKMKDVFISLEASPVKSTNGVLKKNIYSGYSRIVPDGVEAFELDINFSEDEDDISLSNENEAVDKTLADQLDGRLYDFEFGEQYFPERRFWFGGSFRTEAMLDLVKLREKYFLDFHTLNLRDIIDIRQAVVQGHPGSGKSTIVKYFSWAIASKNNEIIGETALDLIPIPIRAIEFGESLQKGQVSSLDEYVLRKDDTYAPLFKFAISAGKAYIFIDGLDEVSQPALRSRVKERVDDFVADPAYSDNHILITTRIVGYQPDGITGKFPHFELEDLDETQISRFVENWYQAIHEEIPSSESAQTEKKQLLDAVLKNPSIHRMAQNPLLLTIIALIKWQGRALPEQRVLLYDAAAQTLIKSWPLTQRAVEFDELFVREWLAPIAEKIFSNPTSDLMDEYSLSEELTDSMMRLKSLPKIEAKVKTQEMLESISLHSGIILPRGTDEDGRNLYGFLHQTFAEYLTAYCFVGKWEDGSLDLVNYAHDPYWREVLLLMAGHLGTQRRAKAGQFLRAILDLKPSPFEDVIHRNLILAGRILGDAVPAPTDMVNEILNGLVDLWMSTKYWRMKSAIEKVFKLIKNTEYGSVLARIVSKHELNNDQVFQLAETIGANPFIDRLVNILKSDDKKSKLNSAIFLAEAGNLLGQKALYDLLNSVNVSKYDNWRIFKTFIRNFDKKAVVFMLEKNVDLFNSPNNIWLESNIYYSDYPDYQESQQAVLKSIIEDENIDLPRKNKWALAILMPNSLKSDSYLLECIHSELEWFSFRAAVALTRKENDKGVETIISLMSKSEDNNLCLNAAGFLSLMKRDEGIPVLLSALEDPVIGNKLMAAKLLYGKLDNPIVKKVLQDFVRTGNYTIAEYAKNSLSSTEGFLANQEYVDLLLSNQNPFVQLDFARDLARRKIREGVNHLLVLMNSTNMRIVLEAAGHLLQLGNDDSQIRASIEAKMKELLVGENLEVIVQAASTLAKLDCQEGYNQLELLIKCSDPTTRCDATRQLLSIQTQKAFDILKNNLSMMLLDFQYTKYREHCANIAYEFIQSNLASNGELAFKPSPQLDFLLDEE